MDCQQTQLLNILLFLVTSWDTLFYSLFKAAQYDQQVLHTSGYDSRVLHILRGTKDMAHILMGTAYSLYRVVPVHSKRFDNMVPNELHVGFYHNLALEQDYTEEYACFPSILLAL